MSKTVVIYIGVIFFVLQGYSQQTKTIDDVIQLVLSNSNNAKIINNNFSKSKIESSFYKISLLPKITTNISLPYQRSIRSNSVRWESKIYREKLCQFSIQFKCLSSCSIYWWFF